MATRTGSKGQKPHLRLAVACEGGSSGANEVVAIVCEGDGGAHLHLAKVVAGKRRGNLPVSSLGSLGGSGGVHPIPGLHPSVEGRGMPCDVVVLQRREKMSWDTEFGRTLISNENSNSVSVSLSAHKHEYRAGTWGRNCQLKALHLRVILKFNTSVYIFHHLSEVSNSPYSSKESPSRSPYTKSRSRHLTKM